MASAEIITIGTEILLGEIVDTNTRYIARSLRNLGVDLYRAVTIGDNVERIASAIREALERAEIVITTGGLGPTVDDPTREAVARAVGVQVEFREELWQQVAATIHRYGRTPTENQKRQAFVPQNALAIPNPVGTAPAFIVEMGRAAVISLPGVPKEMEYLLHESVIPYLQKRFDLRQLIKVRVLHTSGLGEGAIDEQIGDLETLANPTVGLAAHNGVVDIRIAAKAETEAEADRKIAEVEQDLRARLGGYIFGVDDDTLEGVTLALAEARGWGLACLQSGLPDSLARRLPAPLTLDLRPGSVMDELRAALERDPAKTAALGIACYVDDMSAELGLITPEGETCTRLTYGGHPRNLPRWAFNNGLNLLRLAARPKG
ncbi:MAG: competence/damage-inducible protein A [Chloroflexota bacterium]